MKVKRLEPAESDTVPLRSKLPKGQNATGQFVIAVLDALNNVPEANEENNVIVSPPILSDETRVAQASDRVPAPAPGPKHTASITAAKTAIPGSGSVSLGVPPRMH